MKKTIHLILIICFSTFGFSQNEIISPSPNASGLGIYGSTPVGYYTGVPNISIPLYEIKSGSLSLPLSLSYYAGGIRPNQDATWVGLGWVLNSGGVITRSIVGYNDFENPNFVENAFSYGYYYNQDFPGTENGTEDLDLTDISQVDLAYYKNMANGLYDSQPDVFYFNFATFTGTFYFDRKRNSTEDYAVPICKKRNNLDIKYYPEEERWVIIDGEGNKYYFESTELAHSLGMTTSFPYNPSVLPLHSDHPDAVSSWYLDAIVSSIGDSINFSYIKNKHWFKTPRSYSELCYVIRTWLGGERGYPSVLPMRASTYSVSCTEHQELCLREITFKGGKVSFEVTDRDDLDSGSPYTTTGGKAHKLDKIIVLTDTDTIMQYKLHFSYESNRLLLDSIYKYNKGINGNSYLFTYNKSFSWPSKTTVKIDTWGYYNNGTGNLYKWGYTSPTYNPGRGTLIPQYTYTGEEGQTKTIYGADRDVDTVYNQMGILQSITYPTGGNSEFEYETNDYFDPEESYYEYEETNSYAKTNGAIGSIPENEDYFTLEKEEFVKIQHGFTALESEMAKLTIGAEEVGYCDFTLLVGGKYGAIIKINDDQSVDTIRSYSMYPGEYLFEETTICENLLWEFVDVDSTYLEAGTYKVLARGVFLEGNFVRLNYVSDSTLIPNINEKGGGLRIKKITDTTGEEQIEREFTYNSSLYGQESSGILMTDPEFISYIDLYMSTIYLYGTTGVMNVTTGYKYLVGMSNSYTPIGYSAAGSSIGYSCVSESFKGGEGGKKVMFYLNTADQNQYRHIPGVPSTANLSNGILRKEYIFDESDNLLRKKINVYKKSENFNQYVKGIVLQKYFGPDKEACLLADYNLSSEWWKLESETMTNYSLSNDSIQEVYQYLYNEENLLVNKITNPISDGGVATQEITYTCDILDDNGVYEGMKTANMIELPVEIRRYVDGKLVDSNLTTYQEANGLFLPYKRYTLNNAKPISGFSNFSGSVQAEYNQTPEMEFVKYNDKGKVLQMEDKSGKITSYVWGYNNQYPVAKIINAAISQVEGALGLTHLSDGVGSGGLNDIQNTNLRKIPGALVTTYTYNPLIGITSITDPNGRITYYEYDSFGRLEYIKDQDHNILQKYDYKYATETSY
ncbi:RHS repeat domain-containing protein [Saccharicrinis fermentans]|uniref:RHS repeat n=1 Tax=Saccharicrinis fermentans DSM 9555 = JCM 21142 TaxID=869213 RepID=W7Y3W2_9BACT|nr:RHS repeat domain-containing protein [Saccharicrinis fermentans]GAF05555.1 RHS repeat [Saccharicrinis fermentans DSM 9555 = JCM 21142]